MALGEIFSQLKLRLLNFCLQSCTCCLLFILFLPVWIQFGSGSTTLLRTLTSAQLCNKKFVGATEIGLGCPKLLPTSFNIQQIVLLHNRTWLSIFILPFLPSALVIFFLHRMCVLFVSYSCWSEQFVHFLLQ